MNYKDILFSEDYYFLDSNPHLGSNIILLALGGSHAYGTNIETSDIDLRGCALNRKQEILTNEKFEVFTDEETDTTIYSFNQLLSLLCNSNPNVIEILGCRPEHYLFIHPIGQELLDNKELFLSKKAYYSFGGYATAQLHRLSNKAVRTEEQAIKEHHILNSIMNAYHTFPEKYFEFDTDSIHLYVDKSDKEEMDSEIFMDVKLHHYPLRDYKSMWSEMHNIVKDYSKIGKRNKHAVEHGKLGKHMMHLIRLYLMCLDILEKHEINTYRENEKEFLLEIRNGKYLDENDQPISEFYEMVDDFEKKLQYAKENTDLPEKPKYKEIQEFMMSVNERVVNNELF